MKFLGWGWPRRFRRYVSQVLFVGAAATTFYSSSGTFVVHNQKQQQRQTTNVGTITSTNSAVSDAIIGPLHASQQNPSRRSFTTRADVAFRKNQYQALPDPFPTPHLVLEEATKESKILVIGDIHGCLDELERLHEKARQEYNNRHDFDYVILVGDLVNKGPFSAQVIQYVMDKQQQTTTHPRWYAVKGNHDLGALRQALLLGQRQQRDQDSNCNDTPTTSQKYTWITQLTDRHVQWLADLPYTIRIPQQNVLVVHAGFLPGVSLEDQTVETMVTLRTVSVPRNTDTSTVNEIPWAEAWKGPEFVIFGHDAKRGLQATPTHALGLDTGCCYGNKLTAVILPHRQLVSVDAQEVYSPILPAV